MKINQHVNIKLLLYCLIVFYFTGLLVEKGIAGLSISEIIIDTVLFVIFILGSLRLKGYWKKMKELTSKREKGLYICMALGAIGYCIAYVYVLTKSF